MSAPRLFSSVPASLAVCAGLLVEIAPGTWARDPRSIQRLDGARSEVHDPRRRSHSTASSWLALEIVPGPRAEPAMSEIAYRAEILIERHPGSIRKAYLPAEAGPVPFGTHGAIASHYGRAPGTYEPHATTIDYLVAATGG
jgi:hypothetical protein